LEGVAVQLIARVMPGLALLGLFLFYAAATPDLCVDPVGGDCYMTIQGAIDAASSEQTILLRPGIYSETIVINKNLALRGDVGGTLAYPVLDGGGIKGPLLSVEKDVFATISGLSIYNAGTLTMVASTISDNQAVESGGGIFNTGTLFLAGCMLEANSAASAGGAIANYDGRITILNSTIAGNTTAAGGNGGAISNFDSAPPTQALVILSNVTLADNRVGDGNSSGNGNGLFTGGGADTRFKNSIIANAGPAGTGDNCAGTEPISLGYNLEDANSCWFNQAGDRPNQAPELLPPALNAPGLTRSMALSPSSPARNAGSGCEAADQRGVIRSRSVCDMGAYELEWNVFLPYLVD
jgi:hypothetical protein